MTFRSKTILGVALLQILLVTVLLVTTLGAMTLAAREEVERRAEVTARLIGASAKDAMVSKDFATLDALTAEARAANSVAYLRFVDENGAVLSQTEAAVRPSAVVERSQPIRVAGADFGTVLLGIDRSALEKTTFQIGRQSVLIALGGIALTALFSWVLGSYLTSQLDSLRQAGARLAEGDLTARVPIKGADELANTARAFNSMAERLQNVVRKLAEDEATLRTFSEASSDWYWEADPHHRLTWLSPTFAHATKADPAQFIGRPIWENAQRDGATEDWTAHKDDLVARRKIRNVRFWIGKGRTSQWISLSGAPRYDGIGNFIGYCGSGSNITAQADAALKLRLFSRIVEQSPVSVVVTYDRAIHGGDIGPFDCGAVTNALVNAAWSRGLGCVINSQGIMQSPVVREHAGIPDDQVIMICVAMGYPDDSFPANAVVSNRKPVDEAVVFVGFED